MWAWRGRLVAGTFGIQPLVGAFGVPYQAAEPRDERQIRVPLRNSSGISQGGILKICAAMRCAFVLYPRTVIRVLDEDGETDEDKDEDDDDDDEDEDSDEGAGCSSAGATSYVPWLY